jgi:Zn-dependent protease
VTTPTQPPARPARDRRAGLRVGRAFGAPVFLAPSWVLVATLLTYSLAPVFADPHTPGPRHYAAAFGAAVLFAVSVLAHELGHAAVATRLGIPIKRVTLYLFGGVSEMEREPDTAPGEYLVATAGPLVSVLLAGVAAAVARSTATDTTVHRMAAYVSLTNAVLGVLNLLTGSRDAGTHAGVRGGQALAFAVAALGLIRIGAGDPYGSFELLVGAFLWTNATALGRRSDALRRVARLDAKHLARPALEVDATTPLSEALKRAVDTGRRLLVVDSYGAPAGVISGQALAAVPERRRPWVSVADVSRPIEAGLLIEDTLTGTSLLDRMRATPASEYLVTAPDGSIEGVLSAHDVARVLEGREVPAT